MKVPFDSFIFSHIPKCGGSSFRKFIFDSSLKSEIDVKKIHIPGEGGVLHSKNLPNLEEAELKSLKLQKVKIIADHSKFNAHKSFKLDHLTKPFYFTILRNPIERVISHYNFFYYKVGYSKCKGVPLNDLPDKKLEKILAVISNLQVRYLTNQQIFKNVTNAECERAINILTSRYSSFGILEKMEDSVKLFKARKPNWLNLIEKVPVKNVNKANTSKRKPNNDILSLIKDLNSKDMILYEYAIALFNSYLALENEKAV